MKVEALKPLNYKGKTVKIGSIVEIEDVAAKKLIDKKAVKEVKNETKNLTGDQKWEQKVIDTSAVEKSYLHH